MRPLRALLHAMRTRRTHRIDLTQADRLAAGDPPGSDHPGLADLLDAARAPATAEELAGEKAVVAAFTANRKRAARKERRTATRDARKRTPSRTRATAAAAGLALLILGGTATAARTGNLPREAQQHAHRLFSALGIPAPRTGTTPTPGPSPAITTLDWCEAWRAAPGGPPLTSENRRKLSVAAGGEERIAHYCATLGRPASGPPAPTSGPSR
jgi:hypothetical protein